MASTMSGYGISPGWTKPLTVDNQDHLTHRVSKPFYDFNGFSSWHTPTKHTWIEPGKHFRTSYLSGKTRVGINRQKLALHYMNENSRGEALK